MHPLHRPGSQFLPSLALLGFVIGCGASDPLHRQAVSGQVTLNGAPLDSGVVEFSPQGQGTQTGGAVVQAGRYAIGRSQGLPPGKYLVRLYAATTSAQAAPSGPPGPSQGPPAQERIPASWNSQSNHVVEVVKKGKNTFDFTVQTQP